MFGWLGEPEEFADPRYDSISARVADGARLNELIIDLFAQQKGADLVEEAARRGVPLAQVLTLGQAITSEHFTTAGTVVETELAPGLIATVPVGCIDIDGRRDQIRHPAPALGQGSADVAPPPPSAALSTSTSTALPFEGLRSEEHTSELQTLMRTSYAALCLKQQTK